jgi:iron complex transport system substrate-binding protein
MSLDPDLIILSFMEDGYESVNAKGLRHKVLRDFMNARPQVNVPGALWPCAGPGLIEAAEMIADGLDDLK